jgi:hypothetical protein
MKLADARRLAMSLPAVTEEPHFQFTSFRVKGKMIATAPPDGEFLHVFVADEDRDPAIALHPEFIEKLLWGGKVRGLKIQLARAKPKVVADLLRKVWTRKAPKSLLSKLPIRLHSRE